MLLAEQCDLRNITTTTTTTTATATTTTTTTTTISAPFPSKKKYLLFQCVCFFVFFLLDTLNM
jgi:hypothetical protein